MKDNIKINLNDLIDNKTFEITTKPIGDDLIIDAVQEFIKSGYLLLSVKVGSIYYADNKVTLVTYIATFNPPPLK